MISRIIELGAQQMGIQLSQVSIAAFESYCTLLEQRGKEQNLTAIKNAEDVARLHFLDSLAAINTVEFHGKRLIDVGSGAGFPGIPIKLAEPTVELTLLDAMKKRVDFLSELCATLGIDVLCLQARAEEAAHLSEYRESFDIAISRALAQLNVLCELCIPFLTVGSKFLAMKGPDAYNEIEKARNAIHLLGADFVESVPYVIPGTDIVHSIAVIQKTSATPAAYPRRFARIMSNPL